MNAAPTTPTALGRYAGAERRFLHPTLRSTILTSCDINPSFLSLAQERLAPGKTLESLSQHPASRPSIPQPVNMS